MAISKPGSHDVDRAGKRLVRHILEPLKWVVNDVQEDYGIDSNVQVFEANSPTGAWFHLQLKSSAVTEYSADGQFLTQALSVDHAKHYAVELQDPIFVFHADVALEKLYWYPPQLDVNLSRVLSETQAHSIRIRIPTRQTLPSTTDELVHTLYRIYVLLAGRKLTRTPAQTFADSLVHFPDQKACRDAFQKLNDTIKLRYIGELFQRREFSKARLRAEALLVDPDSTVDMKFWAQVQLQGIHFAETLHSGRPQSELAKGMLADAILLQKLTKTGPRHLKFYSLIARKGAELSVLTHQDFALFMAFRQHTEYPDFPIKVLELFARRIALTRCITRKYNQCVRLSQIAARYKDRWILGRALTGVVQAIAAYLITLKADGNDEAHDAVAQSAIQICKLSAWISEETGDSEGVVMAIMGALMTTHSSDSAAFKWANQTARGLTDAQVRSDALESLERAQRRWAGEKLQEDYHGDTKWQIVQNIASAQGIDLSNENDPIACGLRIAIKDDSYERVLRCCEHILVGQGAMGPTARRIHSIFNITTAGSKVIHCLLHGFRLEGKTLDSAHTEFRTLHCDSCPDKRPRPEDWRYTPEVRDQIILSNMGLFHSLAGKPFGLRFTDVD